MDFFELNKLAGGLLLAGVVTFFIGIFGNTLVPKQDAAHHGAPDAAMAAATPAAAPAKPAGPEPIAAMLAEADIARGESITRKCTACHTFAEGGATKQGAESLRHRRRGHRRQGGLRLFGRARRTAGRVDLRQSQPLPL